MIVLVALGCAGGPGEPTPAREDAAAIVAPAPDAPDLVLVGVAGLRADPVTRAADQFLAPFAGEPGYVWTEAHSQSPAASVSLGSVLTGRYPSAIPMCASPTGPDDAERAAPWCTKLPSNVATVPRVLGLYGYRTALVTADLHGARALGAAFQDHVVVSEDWDERATDWTAVERAAKVWWDADDSRPRLLVVATSDLDARWIPGLRQQMRVTLDTTGLPTGIDHTQVYPAYTQAAGRTGLAVRALVGGLSPGRRARYTTVFGIHGINLGDSQERGQVLREGSWSDLLLERTTHVPLAMFGPFGARGEVSDLVELVDVAPTVLALAGAVAPSGLPGRDLLRGSREQDPWVYAEFGDMLSVRRGDWMLALRAFLFNRSALDPELTNYLLEEFAIREDNWWLHDVRADPLQGANRLSSEPDRARELHALLVELRTGPGAPPPSALDARKVWELRMSAAQGYW